MQQTRRTMVNTNGSPEAVVAPVSQKPGGNISGNAAPITAPPAEHQHRWESDAMSAKFTDAMLKYIESYKNRVIEHC